MIQFRTFELHEPAYKQELELRDEVLRRPLHMSIYEDDLSSDQQSIHIGAFNDDILIGTLQFLPLEQGNSIKMRQFAVKPAFQGQQIGHRLLLFAEQLAQQKQYERIILHARKVAIGFYLKQGYRICSNEFTEVGIPHVEMEKELISG